jgi:hypothetical protein
MLCVLALTSYKYEIGPRRRVLRALSSQPKRDEYDICDTNSRKKEYKNLQAIKDKVLKRLFVYINKREVR